MIQAKQTNAHTPGPWAYARMIENINLGFLVFSKTTLNTILHFNSDELGADSEKEVEGNARLIAAAPEMLEALQAVRDYYEVKGAETPTHIKVITAINKATSGNPHKKKD